MATAPFVDRYEEHTANYIAWTLNKQIEQFCFDHTFGPFIPKDLQYEFTETYALRDARNRKWQLSSLAFEREPVVQRLQAALKLLPNGVQATIRCEIEDERDHFDFSGTTAHRFIKVFLRVLVSELYASARYATYCEGAIVRGTNNIDLLRAANEFYAILSEKHAERIEEWAEKLIEARENSKFYPDHFPTFAVLESDIGHEVDNPDFDPEKEISEDNRQVCLVPLLRFEDYGLSRLKSNSQKYGLAKKLTEVITKKRNFEDKIILTTGEDYVFAHKHFRSETLAEKQYSKWD